jgi:hypothetical protein
MSMVNIPQGLRQVSHDEFFKLLHADKRDIMPRHSLPDYTTWETLDRTVIGWTFPGWKDPGNPNKLYAWRT